MESELRKDPLNNVKPNKLKCEVECLKETLTVGRERSVPCKLAVKNEESYLVAFRDIGLALYEKGKLIFTDVDPKLRFANLEHLDVVFVRSLGYYLLCSNNKLYKKRIDSSAPYLFMDIELNAFEMSCFKMVPDYRCRVIFVDLDDQMFLVNLKTGKIEIKYSRKTADQEGDKRLKHYQPHRVNWKLEANAGNPDAKSSILVTQLTNDRKIISFCPRSRQILKATNLEPFLEQFDTHEDENVIDPDSFTLCPKNRYICLKIMLYHTGEEYPILALFEIAEDYGLSFVASIKSQEVEGPQSWAALSVLRSFGYFGEQRLLFVGLEDSWVKKDGCLIFFEFNTQGKPLTVVSSLKTVFEEKQVTQLSKLGEYFYYSGGLGKVMRFRLVKA